MSDAEYVGPPRLLNLTGDVKGPEPDNPAHCILNLNLEDKSPSSQSQLKLKLSKSTLEAVISSLEKVKSHFDTIAGHQTTKSE